MPLCFHASMCFWSVSWLTNCPVYFSLFLDDQFFFGWPKTKFSFFWSTNFFVWLTKNHFLMFLVDQYEIDRTIGRPRDWPKAHGRRLWYFLYKYYTKSIISRVHESYKRGHRMLKNSNPQFLWNVLVLFIALRFLKKHF